MAGNPYLNRVAIRDAHQFFGRKRELGKIFSRVGAARPQSVSVVGPRRIGKSSLLRYIDDPKIRKLFLESPDQYVFFYMDLQQRRDIGPPEFFKGFFSLLRREIPDSRVLGRAAGQDFESIRDALEWVHSRGYKVVVLFDEFDAITANERFTLDFYSFLRSLANNFNVAYVTSSNRDLQELCHADKIADSPFFNIFTNVYLRTFTEREALDLITQPSAEAGYPLAPHAGQIFEMAGRFPFYLQIACSVLFDQLQEYNEVKVAEAHEAFLEEARVHFQYSWDHFSRDEQLVLELVAGGQPVGIEESHVFQELKKGGYIEEADGKPRLFSILFASSIPRLRRAGAGDQAIALPPTELVDYDSPDTKVELARNIKRMIEEEKKLAHFDIIRRLSEGGMGRIYEARDSRLRRRVAIKVLSERFAKNEVVKMRFLREAQTASQLIHPNIATIYETGEAMGVPYIVMELVKGRNLGDLLMERTLEISEIVDIGIQVASALREAHEHEEQIIHRDIKPGNVMITEKNQVKVLDFGLAKPSPLGKLIEGTRVIDVTEEGMVIGTVRYMSPEQAQGKKGLDVRSDIFSLGILLYEITTGFVPFKGESYIEIIDAIRNHEPTPIAALREDAPAELAAVINRCLRKDPKDRYQSAAEIAHDLTALRSAGYSVRQNESAEVSAVRHDRT